MEQINGLIPWNNFACDRWVNFLEYCKEEARRQNISLACGDYEKKFQIIVGKELAKYQAKTDWNNKRDPVWFPDEDTLTQFVLTWC